MAEDTNQERTEPATAKRRQDFRKKGQVAQSKEVHTAALLSVTLLFWFFYAPSFWRRIEDLFAFRLSTGTLMEVTPLSVMNLLWSTATTLAILLVPLFLLTLVVGFLSSFMQVGPLLTAKPLTPDLSKFNVIKGMAKFVSVRSAVELVKSLAKLTLVGIVAYRTVRAEFEQAVALSWMELSQTILFLGHVTFLVLLKSCGVIIVLALLDFLYSRWEMEKKMRMTKQETKEEHKDTDGDPHVKGRIRSLQIRMSRNRMMAEIPNADVVVTNPTHISVAISYVRGEMAAPKIVAKGTGHVALRIREIAAEHGVPRVENVPVARALNEIEIGQEVPEEMFRAVAEILAYVYSLKGQKVH